MPEKNKLKMNSKESVYRRTLKLLLITHWSLGAVCMVLSLILSIWKPELRTTALGILIGGLGGTILIFLMSYSIDMAINRDPQSAQKYMLKHYLARTLLMLGLLLFGVFSGKWMLLGITLGLLCVKISGFLEPRFERRLFDK